MENTQNSKSKTILRIFVIVVIIILLILLSIGIVRVMPKVLNSIANSSLSMSSLFDSKKDSSNNTAETNSNNSTSTISGNTSTSTSGGFSIRDLTNLPANSGNNYVPSAGGFGSAQISTSSNSSNTSNSPLPSTGQTNTTSSNTGNNSGNSQSTPSATNPTKNTVGASDIAVEIISTGILSNADGSFIPTNTFTTNDMVVVKFKIENRGQFATGVWSARIDMPSQNSSDQVKVLNNNQSIPAGVAITGEARFKNPNAGNPTFTITIDTKQTTQDINRNNNTVTKTLNVSNSGSNTGNYGNNYYPNYPTSGSLADLQIRVISTGIVNQFGQYIPNSGARFGDKVAVQFEVANIGGASTPNFSWRADITGAITNTYNSPIEAGLGSGASTNFIVGFDTFGTNGSNYYENGYNNLCNSGPYDIHTGRYIGYINNCDNSYNNYYGYNYSNNYFGGQNNQINFNINIDSGNAIYEANENNNSASSVINLSY